MSKKQTARTRKFLRSDATRLSPESIEEIRNAQNNISDAWHIMCKKYHIGLTTYQKIIDNKRLSELTEEWRKIIDSVNISSLTLEDNQESSQSEDVEQVSLEPQCNADTSSSSTNILENRTIHVEDASQNSKNSINLNIVTNGQKDRISQKKKISTKPKSESSSEKNDISRRESDLGKLLDIIGKIVTHPSLSL